MSDLGPTPPTPPDATRPTDIVERVLKMQGEIEQIRAQVYEKVRALEERVTHLDNVGEAINELDDRADESDRKHNATGHSLRDLAHAVNRLANGVTHRDLTMERLERILFAIAAHLKVPEVGP